MAFWKKSKPADVLLPGRATVLTVGSSLVKPNQHAVDMRVRVRVELERGEQYEVTTAWRVEQAQVPKAQEGCSLKVDVVEGRLWEVRPRDGWASWDRIRTPQDPKLKSL